MDEKEFKAVVKAAVKAFQAYTDLAEAIADMEEDRLAEIINPEYFDIAEWLKEIEKARDNTLKAYDILTALPEVDAKVTDALERL